MEMRSLLKDEVVVVTGATQDNRGHGNDSDTEGTHRGELMQEPPLTAAGVH